MRILYVYKDYYPVVGGIENNIRDLAEAFVKRGHQVTVLVCNRAAHTVEEQINGVRVVKVGRLATVASTPLSVGFIGRLRSLQADIVHLHSPYPLGEVAQLLAGRTPYVVTYHADVTQPIQLAIMRFYAPVLRLFLRRAGRVLVTSPNYVATSPYLRPIANRTTVVTSSVDPRRFGPPPVAAPHHTPTILFVGLMRHYKGVDYLIRAMEHVPAEARLVLAGDGPKRVEWEALRDSLGLQERVTFLGRVPDADLPGLYQMADIFVLPATTRAEALGLVTVEAMLSGLPCIATEVGTGTSYLVQEGISGFVVPPRSPEALAQAITRLLADPGLRAQMGRAGRERALREFTLDKMVEQVEGVYQAVAQPSQP